LDGRLTVLRRRSCGTPRVVRLGRGWLSPCDAAQEQ